jgi:hypothetical protein
VKILIAPFLISIITLFNCCHKDEPCLTCPPNIEPGRRDYAWYVDTIYAGGNIINSIDGVSPNDVWITTIPGDFSQTLYHFNGTSWVTDGVNKSLDPYSVRAFSPNNVWSVGASGEIWQYDGATWKLNAKAPSPGTTYYSLNDLDGIRDNDLYSIGDFSKTGSDFYSLIYHYNDGLWTRVNINENPFLLTKIRYFTNSHYLILGLQYASIPNSRDTIKIYDFDGNALHEIFAIAYSQMGSANFTRVSTGMIILRGRNLFISNGNNEVLIVNVNNSLFTYGFDARSEKDILLAMSDGIAHYNGKDIQYLYNLSNTNFHFLGFKIFEKCVFIIGHDWNNNLNFVFRGYLQ